MRVKHEDTRVSGSWFREYLLSFQTRDGDPFLLCVEVRFEVFLDRWREIREDTEAVEVQVIGHCRQWLEAHGLPETDEVEPVIHVPRVENVKAALFETEFAHPGVKFDVMAPQT